MTDTTQSRTLTIRIERPLREVYEFLAVPENVSQWASGLGGSLAFENGTWTAETPLGVARIVFTPRNELGVVDHRVTLPTGAEIHVPMRVVANGKGSEVLLTLFRSPEMTDEKFAADAAWIERDLAALKAVLEGERKSSC